MRTWLTVARRLLLVAVLAALLAGWGNRPEPAPTTLPRIDVLVAVDVTTSMSALDDPAGSRLTAVRRDLVALARELEGARFALLTFGADDELRVPLTADVAALAAGVGSLQVEAPTAGNGTSLGAVVPALRRQLDGLARTGGADPAVAGVPVVVVVSDGENTRPGPQRSFAEVGDLLETAVVLGYGTAAGGVMPVARVPVDAAPPAAAEAGPLVTDRSTGEPARSRLDPDNLALVARELGGSYVPGAAGRTMAEVARSIEEAAYDDLAPVQPRREVRWLWALALLLLTAPELRQGWRTHLEARREASS